MKLSTRISRWKFTLIFLLMMLFADAVLAQSGLSDDGPVIAEPGTNGAQVTGRGTLFINSVRIAMVGRHYVPLEEGQTVAFIRGDLLRVQWDDETPLFDSYVEFELEGNGTSRRIPLRTLRTTELSLHSAPLRERLQK